MFSCLGGNDIGAGDGGESWNIPEKHNTLISCHGYYKQYINNDFSLEANRSFYGKMCKELIYNFRRKTLSAISSRTIYFKYNYKTNFGSNLLSIAKSEIRIYF